MTTPAPGGPLGRDSELARGDDLLSDAAASPRNEAARGLLVAGDAGIGKTTLVNALVARAEARGFAVGVGHCVDVSVGMPFGPVLEAIRGLDGGTFAPGADATLGVLLDEAAGRSEARPTVLVLEDVHWADRYTVDFAVAFLRTVRARTLLVLTYRAEDVTPGLHHALVDLRRAPSVVTMPLRPLGSAALAQLAARRIGRRLADDSLAGLLARSEGNPLFAEELLDAESNELPVSLSDLLTRHVRTLSPVARDLLRLASAAGSLLDVPTLQAVAHLDPAVLDALLREALDAHVLVRQSDALAFRHALLRDAVYDGLLPNERLRVHRAYAIILSDRLATASSPGQRWRLAADLASHANAAQDLPRALQATVDAAEGARTYGARVEAAQHYQAALGLWDRVPASDRPSSTTKPDLARLAAVSLFTLGQPGLIRDLLRTALALTDDEADPLVASRVYAAVATLPHFPQDLVSQADAVERAIRLAGPGQSSERVDAYLAAAHVNGRQHRYRALLDNVKRAQEAAELPFADVRVAQLKNLEALALYHLGSQRDASQPMLDAARLAAVAGDVGSSIDAMGNAAWIAVLCGRHEDAAGLAKRITTDALRAALPAMSAIGTEQLLYGLIFRGRLREAQTLLEDSELSTTFEYRRREMWSELAMAQGDVRGALENDQWSVRASLNSSYQPVDHEAVRRAAILGAVADVDGERRWADRFMTAVQDTDSPLISAVAAYLGSRVMAYDAGPASEEELSRRTRRALHSAREGLSTGWEETWHGAHLAYAQAYLARLAGQPAHEEWERGIERAERVGAYLALQPRLGLAVEHLTAGDRSAGKQMLASVWQDAREMGAEWYRAQAEALATRNRVPLPTANEAAGPLHRLTPREREVLALLAEGATDRAIAETLVISTKTASLHVGNILAKLDVPNRGAAAALARDLGTTRS
jgi:DNA-binding CsgD family transcriptional regulator